MRTVFGLVALAVCASAFSNNVLVQRQPTELGVSKAYLNSLNPTTHRSPTTPQGGYLDSLSNRKPSVAASAAVAAKSAAKGIFKTVGQRVVSLYRRLRNRPSPSSSLNQGSAALMEAAMNAPIPPPAPPVHTPSPFDEKRMKFGTLINEEARLHSSSFPISHIMLKERLKTVLDLGVGTEDPSILTDDFQFCAPVVGPLSKEEYLGALEKFDLLTAFPDLDQQVYNIHVDPFEPDRVWFMTRPTATHTGPLFGKEPTGKSLQLPPQTNSVRFDERGMVTELTIGYVADRRIGNTGGLGGAFGLFYGVGQGLPIPECQPYKPSLRFRLLNWIERLRSSKQKE